MPPSRHLGTGSIFAREVLADLVRKELLRLEWAERILSWQHTGFKVHSFVRARKKIEAERVGKYMIRPLLSLERLPLDEKEGKVIYPIKNSLRLRLIVDNPALFSRP